MPRRPDTEPDELRPRLATAIAQLRAAQRDGEWGYVSDALAQIERALFVLDATTIGFRFDTPEEMADVLAVALGGRKLARGHVVKMLRALDERRTS